MPLRRYLGLFRPHLPGLAVAAVLLGLSAAMPGALVWALRWLVDRLLAGEPLGTLPVALVALAALEGAVSLGRTALTKRVAWRVATDLRRRAHAHLLALSPRQVGSTGARLATLSHEIDEVQYGVSALVTAARNPLTLAVLGATAWAMAPALALGALALVPLLGACVWAGGALLRRRAAASREARSALLALAQEQVSGIRTIQAFGAEARERRRFEEVAEADRRARLRLEVDRVLPSAVLQVLAAAVLAGLLAWGAAALAAGALEPGRLVGFVVALGLMRRPLAGLGEVWALLQRSLGALERAEALLATPPELTAPERPAPVPDAPFALRWEGVTADHGDGPVLRNVDLEARPGEILVIVGPSGAGKSTLLQLVDRRRDPVSGRVRLGDRDVRELDPAALRRAVATVDQQGFLFARSVRENLAPAGDAPDEALRHALALAGALDVVDALPQGLDTILDERAQRLSGGERQRLELARALLTGSPVLLLDEATNQIDHAAERALIERLHALKRDRVVVMVAHDPGVAARADRVAVVAHGRLVATGTPAELLEPPGGPFARPLPALAPRPDARLQE